MLRDDIIKSEGLMMIFIKLQLVDIQIEGTVM